MHSFRRVYVEIINYCNLSCSFCPRTKRKKEAITVENFSRLLDEIKPYTEYIYLHIKGEPLLHKDLVTLLRIAKQKGFYVNITTNGTLINVLREAVLEGLVRQVNISLHSFEGSKGEEFDKYLRDIILFTKEVTVKSAVYIALRLWNLDKTISSSQRERNKSALETIEKSFDLKEPIDIAIDQKKGVQLANNTYLNYDYEFVWPSLDAPYVGETGYCYGLKTQMGILVDGTVVPCCLDGEGVIQLGNIYTDGLQNILQSKRVKEITEGFRDRRVVEPMCQRCGYRERF